MNSKMNSILVEEKINYLQDPIFPVMLITNPKKFSMNFPSTEPELNECHKSIGFEGQSIFDVTLCFESCGDSRSRTRQAHPTTLALTLGFVETSNTETMFRTSCRQIITQTLIFNGLTAWGLLVTRVSRVSQIVQLYKSKNHDY